MSVLLTEGRTTIATKLEELATALTLPNFIVLYQACKFVPYSFLNRRETIIANILRASNVDLSGVGVNIVPP